MNDQTVDATALLQELTRATQGRYVLGDVLGFGRGGVTVRAQRVATGEAVALKIAWENANALAQMMRESVLTMKVAHPHVLPVQRVDITGGTMLVIEMPLAAGTVDDLFETGVPIPYARVCEIMSEVAGALDFAHENGIVHGGLRPVKLLLDAAGHCMVTDFGLRIPPVSERDVAKPSTVGSPAYTPAEQRHDSPDIDARIDQFALAVIAYELLRGRRSWNVNADGVIEIEAIELMAGRPIAPGVPSAASLAIRRATSREAGFRYDSVSEFVRALSDTSIHADIGQHIHRATVRVERRRSAAWMVLPTAALIVAGLALKPSFRNGAARWWRAETSNLKPQRPDLNLEIEPMVPLAQTASAAPNEQPQAADRRNAPGDTPRNASSSATPPATSTRPNAESREPSRAAMNPTTPPTTTQADASPAPSNTRFADPSPTNTNTRVGGTASAAPRTGTAGGPNAVAAASSGSILVSLKGNGTSEVFIDGHNRGRTPLVWSGKPGSHVVMLRDSSAYSPTIMNVVIAAGDTVRALFTPGRPR